MKELTVLLIGMFILLLLSFCLSEYDFFSPSFIACLMFTFSTALAIYATVSWRVSETVFSGKATFIMLSGMAIFIASEQFVKNVISKRKPKNPKNIEYPKPLYIYKWKIYVVIIFCIASSLLCTRAYYKMVRLNGYRGDFNFASIAVFYHNLTFVADKEGGIPRWLRWLQQGETAVMFICIYLFTNNVIGCREKIRKNFIYLIPILCWIPNLLMTSSRSVYIQLAGSFVLTGYIVLCRKNGWRRMKKNYQKILTYSALAFILLLVIFYIAVANGAIGRQTNKTFLDYITMYVGAPIIHFNQFMTSPPNDVVYFGQETFSKLNPLLYRLGLVQIQTTNQLEMRVITGIYRGNVYTFFRRPYHDFGLLGMYVVVMLTAGIFSYVYYRQIYGRQQSFRNDRILILYSYFFYIVYLISILCEICNLVYFGIIYFIVIFYIVYGFMFGQWGVKFENGIKFFIRKAPHSISKSFP